MNAVRVAVVTGAGRGIGRGVAVALARSGFLVVVNCFRHRDEAVETLRLIRVSGSDGFVVQADVSTEVGAKKLFAAAGRKYKKLDVLVNNAGTEVLGGIEDMPMASWDKVINTNLRSVFLCTKHAVPLLKKSAAPSVVNISSRLSIKPYPDFIAYGCSKAGVNALTAGVAESLSKHHVRVNAVMPATTPTSLVKKFLPAGELSKLKKEGKVATLPETVELVMRAVRAKTSGKMFKSPRLRF